MLNAGYIEVDITPPLGLRLGGFMNRLGLPSRGFKDPLYARILVLGNGKEEFAIIQLDLLGIYRSYANTIRDAIYKALGVKNVMVATTHTHSAPETVIPMWPNTLPYTDEERALLDLWMKSVVEKIEEATGTLSLETVEDICVSYTNVEGLCYNRSFPGEIFDSETPIIMIRTTGRKTIVYSSPCHPVCNTDLYYSADYHAYVVSTLSSNNIKAIPLTGAAGNVSPMRKGYYYAKSMGSELAKRIINSLTTCKRLEPVISLGSTEVEIPLRRVEYEQALKRFREAYNKYIDVFMAERAKGIVDERYFTMFEEPLYADQELEVAKLGLIRNTVTELQVFRIGGINLVSFPGEMVSETSLLIKRALLEINNIFSTYTNDYIGYVPTEKFFDNSRYEARTALWSIVDRKAEPLIRSRIIDLIRDVV